MADKIRRADYYYTMAPDKPGEGARILRVFKDAGVNFLAFHAFPSARRSQLDFFPADRAAFRAAARKARIKLSPKKTAFLIDGRDRVGAIAAILRKLAAAKINVTALDGVCTRDRRYGAILWVSPRHVRKAAAVLRAR